MLLTSKTAKNVSQIGRYYSGGRRKRRRRGGVAQPTETRESNAMV